VVKVLINKHIKTIEYLAIKAGQALARVLNTLLGNGEKK